MRVEYRLEKAVSSLASMIKKRRRRKRKRASPGCNRQCDVRGRLLFKSSG